MLHFIKETISEPQRAHYFRAELKNDGHNQLPLPHKSGSTTQRLYLSAYLPACVEKLFSLVGLLDLDLGLSKSPSDTIWSSAKHPRRRGPSRGPWPTYTVAHIHTCTHTCIHAGQRRMCWVLRVIRPQKWWRQRCVIHAVHVYAPLSSSLPSPPAPPSSSPSITPPHTTYKTLTHCNSVTFLWHDLWPSSPQPASCSCFYTRREDRACFDGWRGSWREGWTEGGKKGTWKTLLVGKPLLEIM